MRGVKLPLCRRNKQSSFFGHTVSAKTPPRESASGCRVWQALAPCSTRVAVMSVSSTHPVAETHTYCAITIGGAFVFASEHSCAICRRPCALRINKRHSSSQFGIVVMQCNQTTQKRKVKCAKSDVRARSAPLLFFLQCQ